MRKDDLVAFARRDWKRVAEMKDRFWVEQKLFMSAAGTLGVVDDLRAEVVRRRGDWPSDEERNADLATHARVAESLERSASPVR